MGQSYPVSEPTGTATIKKNINTVVSEVVTRAKGSKVAAIGLAAVACSGPGDMLESAIQRLSP